MKKKKPHGKTDSCSWREIRQTASRKLVTSHARRRILRSVLRGILGCSVAVLVAVGTYYGIGYWKSGIDRVNTALPSQPLREVVFSTDGVLTQSWVERALDLPEDIEIMAVDIHHKKLRLEAHGQVKTAVIRRLPDRLVVDVQERMPVARLATRGEGGRVVEYLVDREGFVYQGFGYDRYELSTLPFLAGVSLTRTDHGFRRLPGMDQVDDLLRIARAEMPHLYDAWNVIDCGNLPLLTVRSDDFKEIIFGSGRFIEQLRMLDMIVESNRRQLAGRQDKVDLSLGNQVVVR